MEIELLQCVKRGDVAGLFDTPFPTVSVEVCLEECFLPIPLAPPPALRTV